MLLVVGLGNPGRPYSRSRHNLGFMVLEALARQEGLRFREHPAPALVARARIAAQEVLLAKPLTFMNRSGLAVKALLRELGLGPSGLLLVHDDMDLPPGALKIRQGGSAAGHKGVASVIQALGTEEFLRLKLGIGKPPPGQGEGYVLSPPGPKEEPLIREAVALAVEALQCLLAEGPQKAMSLYNRPRAT
jgi:PTH1 family peptidyl-tRNA hydrolase